MQAPLLAIVGRPNVGKSTLYNRLIGGRPALVHDTPGLTRDRRYGELDYFGRPLRVVDTGGLDPEADKEVIGAGIHRQARAAMDQADLVLFVIDGNAGVTALDREVATLLRKVRAPVLVCANKMDHPKRDVLAAELYELGLGDVFPLSAAHGRGIDDILDAVIERLALPPPEPAIEVEPELAPKDSSELDSDELNSKKGEGAAAREQKPFGPLRVAFVGKPNAGKSSLMNRLVGVERSLVHHEPGTTMDPVDSPFTFAGRSYVLIDTAGIRRKARIAAETEKIAVSMALAQIRRADVVVLVVDGKLGPSEQDARLAGAIEDSGRAVVVALNKIDLLEGVGAGRDLKQKTRDELHFLPYAPVVMISAARGDGIGALMEAVDRVAAHYRRRISTAELNRFFAEVCETHPPPLHRGHEVRIHYLTQGGIEPPAFVLWANRPGGLSPSYKRFVKNQLRARYGFEGTPLRLFIKAKKRRAANELRRRR